MRKFLLFCLACFLVLLPALSAANESAEESAQYQAWIEEMKSMERGPFARLRWFCNDGTVMPPESYACRDHGGGYQHGELGSQANELRAQGFMVANVLAGLDPEEMIADPGFQDLYAQILIERFLMAVDDGWIFRRALYYRGAIQEEDERAAARELLSEMASRPYWTGPGYGALRAGVRMLPHGTNSASIQKVRQVSASLSDKDLGFKPLRAKIHGTPGAEDADSVRKYAETLNSVAARQPYLDLADEIDGIYQPAPLSDELNSMAARYTAAPWLQEMLREYAARLKTETTAGSRFATTAELLADLRSTIDRVKSPQVRLELLDLSLRAEGENFRAAAALNPKLPGASRKQRVSFLESAGRAAYGTGVVNARLLDEMLRTLKSMQQDSIPLNQYLLDLAYLGRAPGWGTQSLRMHFFDSMEKLAQIEPLSMLFIQDQLRGSPLFIYSKVIDGLSRDANRLAGVKHRLFDQESGLVSLR